MASASGTGVISSIRETHFNRLGNVKTEVAIQTRQDIVRVQVSADSAAEAVSSLGDALAHRSPALVLCFCASRYPWDELAQAWAKVDCPAPVVGCTTAGEMGPLGYRQDSLVGVALPANAFSAVTRCIGPLSRWDATAGHAHVQALLHALEAQAPGVGPGNTFALLLVDGLSGQEEVVTRSLQAALGGIPLVGGSAGDGLNFQRTAVFHGGQFLSDHAVLALVSTRRPFRPFMAQQFVAMPERVVVTSADPRRRLVHEIDGYPAATAYARLTGVDPSALGPAHFARYPLVVMIGGMCHVRSIGQALPDGSLKFFCAIDEGMVLHVGQATDVLDNLRHTLEGVQAALGGEVFSLGFDCTLRRMHQEQAGVLPQVADLLVQHGVVGFSTYGEQFRGVHVNQTFTGLAIGDSSGGAA